MKMSTTMVYILFLIIVYTVDGLIVYCIYYSEYRQQVKPTKKSIDLFKKCQ